jgi:hypothetical protein
VWLGACGKQGLLIGVFFVFGHTIPPFWFPNSNNASQVGTQNGGQYAVLRFHLLRLLDLLPV